MLVHNTLRKAARAQPNVRRRRDAITWQRHQRARRHRRRCETCFEIDFPAERETEKDGVKEGRQLDDVFAPLPPSFPLSHYVLLFHITAKQFEAPKGSPFPSLIFLPPPSSWPTWRVQYILRSYKLSKHGWLAGWLRGGLPWKNSLRLSSIHVAKLPAPLESKNVFSSREIGSITWPNRVRNCNIVTEIPTELLPFTQATIVSLQGSDSGSWYKIKGNH